MSGFGQLPNQLQPIYTTFESVKVRLFNKVQFQSDPSLVEGELPNELLAQLICDAETEVEQDLRGRYSIPFRSKTKGTYQSLPDHSKRSIRMVVDLKAVIFILGTDFGRAGHTNADEYLKEQRDRYEEQIEKLLGRDKEGEEKKRYRYSPPLEDVLLAPGNAEADDGFKGRIINTDGGHDSATYAEQQVNDPSQVYVNRRIPNGTWGV